VIQVHTHTHTHTHSATNGTHSHTLSCVFFVLCVAASAAALTISEKQRVRLQRQALAMSQYCALMVERAKAMLRFLDEECPADAGNVLTLFRKRYPQYGLRAITLSVTKKIGMSVSVSSLPCVHCYKYVFVRFVRY